MRVFWPPGHVRQVLNVHARRVSVRFTDNYPLESPEVVFIPPAPIHPHIYSNGHICLDILYDGRNGGWSPALTISKVIISLRSMLASSTDKVRGQGWVCICCTHIDARHRSGQSATTSMWRAWATAPQRRRIGFLRTTTCDAVGVAFPFACGIHSDWHVEPRCNFVVTFQGRVPLSKPGDHCGGATC